LLITNESPFEPRIKFNACFASTVHFYTIRREIKVSKCYSESIYISLTLAKQYKDFEYYDWEE